VALIALTSKPSSMRSATASARPLAAAWTTCAGRRAMLRSRTDRSASSSRCARVLGGLSAFAAVDRAPLNEHDEGPPATTAKLWGVTEAWVYLLRCRDGSLYTGWTVDLDRRLARHRAGVASRYTASRLPVDLELAIPMPDRTAARREEARIKRLSRAAKLALLDAAR
jgi:putative endonuclease